MQVINVDLQQWQGHFLVSSNMVGLSSPFWWKWDRSPFQLVSMEFVSVTKIFLELLKKIYKRGPKILNSKFQILSFGNTFSPLKFDGWECGEYGLVLWASWLSTEPPNEDVGPQWPLTGRASPVSPFKCLEWKEPSSVFQLLSPG